MNDFDHILNWKLKLGSHAFPGRDGGTCICEAAIVAAGFPYRPERSARDMPGCFSPPIYVLAIYLNDIADDEERQLLLPFVTRLACADTPEVEGAREVHIAWRLRYGSPFREQLEVLEGALAIDRRAGEPAPEAVRTRLKAVRRKAQTPTSVADDPAFTETGAWLAPLLLDHECESAPLIGPAFDGIGPLGVPESPVRSIAGQSRWGKVWHRDLSHDDPASGECSRRSTRKVTTR